MALLSVSLVSQAAKEIKHKPKPKPKVIVEVVEVIEEPVVVEEVVIVKEPETIKEPVIKEEVDVTNKVPKIKSTKISKTNYFNAGGYIGIRSGITHIYGGTVGNEMGNARLSSSYLPDLGFYGGYKFNKNVALELGLGVNGWVKPHVGLGEKSFKELKIDETLNNMSPDNQKKFISEIPASIKKSLGNIVNKDNTINKVNLKNRMQSIDIFKQLKLFTSVSDAELNTLLNSSIWTDFAAAGATSNDINKMKKDLKDAHRSSKEARKILSWIPGAVPMPEIQLSVKGTYPVTDNVAVYGRLGITPSLKAKSTTKGLKELINDPDSFNNDVKWSISASPIAAVGGEYHINTGVSVRGEVQHNFRGLASFTDKDKNTLSLKSTSVNIGLTYNF